MSELAHYLHKILVEKAYKFSSLQAPILLILMLSS